MTANWERAIDELRAENARLRSENGWLRERLEQALARIAELERTNQALLKRVQILEQENEELKRRNDQLERENSRQAAPFRREESRKIPPEQQKRPGRKPGHRGAYRQRPPQIDEEIEVPLPCCPDCGGRLASRFPRVIAWP